MRSNWGEDCQNLKVQAKGGWTCFRSTNEKCHPPLGKLPDCGKVRQDLFPSFFDLS